MMMDIATDFYTDLYTPSPVDESVQEKLLGHVGYTLTNQQKCMRDADPKGITAILARNEKSPGIDGFTAEFY